MHLEQIFQSLPGVFALSDESIGRHKQKITGFAAFTGYYLAMSALVECVPNFSEGRKLETVRLIAEAIAAVDSACVLDTHIDPDHNRSVITFVAHPEKVV